MKIVNTNNDLNFQSQLNISKIKYNNVAWRRLAARFNDHNCSNVFDLASMPNGDVKGKYITNSVEDAVDFTIIAAGVDDLLSKNEYQGAFFLKSFERNIIIAGLNVFCYKNILKRIDDFTKLKRHFTDDIIDICNRAIASNNNFFENFNKLYKNKGISLDYPPLNYLKKPTTNPKEKDIRINTVRKRIHEANTEINALEKDIQELSKKSLNTGIFTGLFNKLAGKEDIRKTIENKIDQKEELKLTLKVLNDELKYLKSL